MGGELDDIEFLVRSNNRLDVLSALGREPIDRRTIQERSGVERVTLGRILNDFEQRQWMTRNDGGYSLTPVGMMVDQGVTELRETVATANHLRSVVQWLPTDSMSFDLHHLGGANITLPSETDPSAPTRYAGERLRSTDRARLLMSVIVAEVIDACRDATVEGEQTVEAVFTPGVVQTISNDRTMTTQVQEMLETGQVTVYCTDEPVPHILGLLDDITAFGVTDDENLPRAYLETEDPVVRSWAERTYDEHRSQATRIDLAERLPGAD